VIGSLFPNTKITLHRDNLAGNGLATIWTDSIPQFTCAISKCTQEFDSEKYKFGCTEVKCSCNVGTKMCGGGVIDLTAPVNAATGLGNIKCDLIAPFKCTLFFEFISTFFPDGLELPDCIFGECVDKLDSPLATSTTLTMDTAGKVGIVLLSLCFLFIIVSCGYGFYEQIISRKPRIDAISKGQVFLFDHVSYAVNDKQIILDVSGKINPGEVNSYVN
jgi:hypothetical protein